MYRPIPSWRSSLPQVAGDEIDALVKSHPAVAVHFWATWNGADPLMETSILAIRERFAGRVVFMGCDVDQTANVGLCRSWGVANVPTLGVAISNRSPSLIVGCREPEALSREIEKALMPIRKRWWKLF